MVTTKNKELDIWPKRDDWKKEHPNLVPYDHLIEQDKDYNINTAVDTLNNYCSRIYIKK